MAADPAPPTSIGLPAALPRPLTDGAAWRAIATFGDTPPDEVAELAGYGPITPDVARALAAGGTWRRLVVDPGSGTVLDVGRTTYRPPADLARHVTMRDQTCVRPGCSVPAHRCQLDHTTPYGHGGATAAGNLGALCQSDHSIKTAGGFRLEQPSPGTFHWTTPTGHRYIRRPDGSTERYEDATPPPF